MVWQRLVAVANGPLVHKSDQVVRLVETGRREVLIGSAVKFTPTPVAVQQAIVNTAYADVVETNVLSSRPALAGKLEAEETTKTQIEKQVRDPILRKCPTDRESQATLRKLTMNRPSSLSSKSQAIEGIGSGHRDRQQVLIANLGWNIRDWNPISRR